MSHVNDTDKKFYSSIVRAQLSPYELKLILSNSLIENKGYPKFLFLIKEFDIMQNLDKEGIPSYVLKEFADRKENVSNPFTSK